MGSVLNSDILYPHAPAAANPAICSSVSCLTAASRAQSTRVSCRIRPSLAVNCSTVDTPAGASKGMSTIVVTPPAAAAAVAAGTPSNGVLAQCTWASMNPGRINSPVASTCSRAAGAYPGANHPAIRPAWTPIPPSRRILPSRTTSPTINRSSTELVIAYLPKRGALEERSRASSSVAPLNVVHSPGNGAARKYQSAARAFPGLRSAPVTNPRRAGRTRPAERTPDLRGMSSDVET